MKLSDWATEQGVSYITAWRYWKAGQLDAYQLPTGTVIVRQASRLPDCVCIYARVSSSENRGNFDAQASRLEQYAIARGYRIYKTVREVGSGVNDSRKRPSNCSRGDGRSKIIVEHRDRLTRFGFTESSGR